MKEALDPARHQKLPGVSNPRFPGRGLVDSRRMAKATKKAKTKQFAATKRMITPHDGRIVKPAHQLQQQVKKKPGGGGGSSSSGGGGSLPGAARKR